MYTMREAHDLEIQTYIDTREAHDLGIHVHIHTTTTDCPRAVFVTLLVTQQLQLISTTSGVHITYWTLDSPKRSIVHGLKVLQRGV